MVSTVIVSIAMEDTAPPKQRASEPLGGARTRWCTATSRGALRDAWCGARLRKACERDAGDSDCEERRPRPPQEGGELLGGKRERRGGEAKDDEEDAQLQRQPADDARPRGAEVLHLVRVRVRVRLGVGGWAWARGYLGELRCGTRCMPRIVTRPSSVKVVVTIDSKEEAYSEPRKARA